LYASFHTFPALLRCSAAPVFASKPRFLQADPYYRSLVTGLGNASDELHETTLDVEPITGGCMVAHQRLQINVQVKRDLNLPFLANIVR
jgi:hypothetical protein